MKKPFHALGRPLKRVSASGFSKGYRFSRANFLAFALFFAGIGGYVLLKSFAASATLTVDGSQKFQTMSGFGVSINSHSWDNGNLKPAIDMLVDQQGSQVYRVVMEMTDWESTNDDSNPNNYNWTYYNPIYSGATTYDTAQHGANFADLWNTIDYLHQKGIPDSQIILSFMGIGPSWMGGTTVNASMEDEWAEMVTSAAYYGYSHGHTFGIFSPDNEEDWGHNEGIIMSSAVYADAMNKVATRLDALGMNNVRLVGPETASTTSGYTQAMANIPSLMAKVDHIDAHNYGGNSDGFQSLAQSYGKDGWMSEFSVFDQAFDFLGTGQNISGLMMWDAYDSIYNHAILNGLGSQPGNDQGNAPPLIAYNSSSKTYTPRQSFYQFAQLFKYVPIGSVRISDSSSLAGVSTVAFTHAATGRLTIVGENTAASSQTLSIALNNISKLPSTLSYYQTNSSSNFAKGTDVVVSGGTATVTVPANTVFTLTGTNACDLNATTTSFSSQLTAATTGQTICLASGSYGNLPALSKAVTITAAPGAAATLSIDGGGSADIQNFSNFTIDGTLGGGTMTMNGIDLRGSTTTPRNLTFKNLTFTQGASAGEMVYIDGPTNTNILFDHDTFNNSKCTIGTGHRFDLAYGAGAPSGVTVQNSVFDGGSSDGITTGMQMTIINNRFNNIVEGADTQCHTDSVQLLNGSEDGVFGPGTGSVIKGNYFSNSSTAVAAYDGTPNSNPPSPVHDIDIENNVFDNINANSAIILGGDRNSIIIHNTLINGFADIDLTSKAGANSSGETIKDNIARSINLITSGSTTCNCTATPSVDTNNMLSSGATAPNFAGSPTFVSSTKSSHDDYLLTSSSAGHLRATDGTDVGIYALGSGGVTPPPPPTITAILTANPTSIINGSSSTLTWSSTNATSCSASGGWTGAKANSGTQSISPTATTTYTLTCSDGSGNSANSSATVTVSNPAPSGTLLVGNQTLQSTSDTNAAGDAEAFKYTAVASGSTGTIAFYVSSGNTATGLKLGLYSDNGGHPGTLLSSATIASPSASNWNSATLSPTVTVTSGTTYWIAFLGTGGTLAYRDVSSGSCSESPSTSGLSVLPSTWASGQGWPTCSLSAYVLAGASGGTTKVGDINSDGSVNIFDLSILLSKYNTSDASADLNKDGIVNVFDLSILLSHYGT